jgi:NhaA family Na+:H+ antiporter
MVNQGQRAILQTLENAVHKVTTPLQRLEHALHLPVALLIIPIFALANAGIPVSFSTLGTTLAHPVTLGIMLGLVVGKLIGIAGFSWIAIKLGLARLPGEVRFTQIVGVSLLGGIGFTMSIFIAELAFSNQAPLLLQAKTGILFASLTAGILGLIWLYRSSSPERAD